MSDHHMLLLLIALADATLTLIECSVPPLSTLVLGTPGVMCEFRFETAAFDTVVGSVLVTVDNERADALPYYETTLDGRTTKRGSDGLVPSYAVARNSGEHTLTVVFPYTKCTVAGDQLVVRVSAPGDEYETVLYKQAAACVDTLDSDDDMRTAATTATASFLFIYLCVILACFCIACVYINPSAQ